MLSTYRGNKLQHLLSGSSHWQCQSIPRVPLPSLRRDRSRTSSTLKKASAKTRRSVAPAGPMMLLLLLQALLVASMRVERMRGPHATSTSTTRRAALANAARRRVAQPSRMPQRRRVAQPSRPPPRHSPRRDDATRCSWRASTRTRTTSTAGARSRSLATSPARDDATQGGPSGRGRVCDGLHNRVARRALCGNQPECRVPIILH